MSTLTPELSAVAEMPRVSPLTVAEASRDADGLEVPPPPDVDSGELGVENGLLTAGAADPDAPGAAPAAPATPAVNTDAACWNWLNAWEPTPRATWAS